MCPSNTYSLGRRLSTFSRDMRLERYTSLAMCPEFAALILCVTRLDVDSTTSKQYTKFCP